MKSSYFQNRWPLSISNLSVLLRDQYLLKNISLEINPGKIVAVVGPNGAGKTTLLKSLVGLVKPQTGTVLFNGKPFDAVKKSIAYVPQRLTVDWDFPVSVFDVVLMGRYAHLGWFKRPTSFDYNCAFAALDQVGLSSYKDHHIGSLSGGQQQRVFLARALVQEAHVYLMDEPFAGVDITTEKTIISILKGLRDEGKTVVIVHHNIHTLADYFDEIVWLNVSLIGYGPVHSMVTSDYLLQTYGARNDANIRPHMF
jgi:manganese/zinc/iron transport system ATP- binding protein